MKKLPVILLFLIVAISLTGCKSEKTFDKLVWSDEFDTSGVPDSSKWGYETGYIRNNEMQYYTNKPENARVEDGNLIIEARRDSSVIGNDGIKPPWKPEISAAWAISGT